MATPMSTVPSSWTSTLWANTPVEELVFRPSSKPKKLSFEASRFPKAFCNASSKGKTDEEVLEEEVVVVTVMVVVLVVVVLVVVVVEMAYHAVGVLRVVGTALMSF